MKKLLFVLLTVSTLPFFTLSSLLAQTYSFDGRDKAAIQVKPSDTFTPEKGYGYDFQSIISEARKAQNETSRLSDGI